MHNPVNVAIASILLVAIAMGSFYYVYALAPRGPWIGIMDGGFINSQIAQLLGLNEDHGFLIIKIAPSSPAEKAGIKQANHDVTVNGRTIPVGGDIIVSLDGTQINGPDDLCNVMKQKQSGDSIKIGINREGKLQEISLVLEQAPPGSSPEC